MNSTNEIHWLRVFIHSVFFSVTYELDLLLVTKEDRCPRGSPYAEAQ